MKVKPGDLVYVELHDIEHENNGWQRQADIAKAKVNTYMAVGWVLRATKLTLTIAPLTSPRSAFCAYHFPMGSVRKVKRLRAKS